MSRFNPALLFVVFVFSLLLLTGCQHLAIDWDKIVRSDTDLPEIVGIIAGFGATFAAFPDLLAMMRRRSSEGMNPRMGAILGAFQILWMLRPAHRFAASHYLECHCSVHQFSHRWGTRVFPARGEGEVSCCRHRIEIKFMKEWIHETVRSNAA